MRYQPISEKEPCEMEAGLTWLAEIRREEIPWYPTVDPDACVGNGDCLAFCPQDVFRWDTEAGYVVVAAPFHCVIGCRECEQVCLGRAISFPSPEAWVDAQESFRAKIRLASEGRQAVIQ